MSSSTAVSGFQAGALTPGFTVKDLATSMAWYQDVMGFVVDQKVERDGKLQAVALRAGDVRIWIGQDDGAKGWTRVKGEGFSLTFATSQNLDELANRIKQNGGALASEPADMPWGARQFRVVDPDGYKFSISSS